MLKIRTVFPHTQNLDSNNHWYNRFFYLCHGHKSSDHWCLALEWEEMKKSCNIFNIRFPDIRLLCIHIAYTLLMYKINGISVNFKEIQCISSRLPWCFSNCQILEAGWVWGGYFIHDANRAPNKFEYF